MLQRVSLDNQTNALRGLSNVSLASIGIAIAVFLASRGYDWSYAENHCALGRTVAHDSPVALFHVITAPILLFISGLPAPRTLALGALVNVMLASVAVLEISKTAANDCSEYFVFAMPCLAMSLLFLSRSWRVWHSGVLELTAAQRRLDARPWWARIMGPLGFLLAWLIWFAAVNMMLSQTYIMENQAARQVAHGAMDSVPDTNIATELLSMGGILFVTIVVILVPAILGGRMLRRMLQMRAERLLARDARPPVLLLRSFADDTATVTPTGWLARLQRRKTRMEEAAAKIVGPIGPFVAIGAPGERLPQLGAHRGYFADDEWQDAVRDWIERSQTVLMIAGLTEWVKWELNTLIQGADVERTIVIFPPGDRQDRSARLAVLRQCFAKTLWASQLSKIRPDDLVIIDFEAHGEVRVVEATHTTEREVALAILLCLV